MCIKKWNNLTQRKIKGINFVFACSRLYEMIIYVTLMDSCVYVG